MKPIIILHRGNNIGRLLKYENHISDIRGLLHKKKNIEIDVWYIKNDFYLGHDKPLHRVSGRFLENHLLWCHAKNTEALYKMLENPNIHCFWHDKDKHAITSNGFIWQEGYSNLTNKTIVVDLSPQPNYNANCYGICCDYDKIS